VDTETWDHERAGDLAELLELALPDERLTADELLGVCWDDDGVGRSTVLGCPGGEGAIAVAVRPTEGAPETPVGVVTLLVVEPAAQAQGRGRALLEAAHEWAFDEGGAQAVVAGGLVPWYLFPGVDVRFTRALSLAEAIGYRETGAALNLSCSTSVRAKPPAGVALRRVLDEPDAAAVDDLCRVHWPYWRAEAARGVEHGACHAAFDSADGGIVGFACHSVNRGGWVGPIGVNPERQRGGVGGALLSALFVDLRVARHATAEIAWIGPIGFYAKVAGAVVSRVFRTAVFTR